VHDFRLVRRIAVRTASALAFLTQALKIKLMKHAALAFLATTFVAPLALACPGAAACGTCSGFGTWVSSISLGVLIGVASVGVENVLKRRR
jgi:hypothetical protein